MSRYGGGRPPGDDLAYGDLPQRWDRSRFERFSGGPPPRQFEEDYRFQERDTPGRREVEVQDRVEERGPRGRYEERDRYVEEDRYTPAGQRRRTDRELFGDVDPRELANMAVTPYRGPERTTRDEIDIDIRRGAPRPGIMRRQSSLDTFDRRPVPRYEREEIRIPAYTPVPLPIPRDDGFGDYQRGRYNEPEEYREVEIRRERSVRRTGGGPKSHKSSKSSKAKSVSTRRSSSSSSSSSNTTIQEVKSRHSRSHRAPSMHESYHEDIHTPGGLSIHESFHESVHGGASSVSDSITQIEKKFKKGKTRMPKRLVRREAIMDLGYPFDEEDDFFVLRIALEKEQIDEVMKISESYKTEEKKIVYKYEESPALLAPPQEHEEVIRTEWINPPTVAGSRVARSEYQGRRDSSPSGASTTTRRTSPARTARSRRTSHSRHQSQPPPPEFYEQRKTVIEERVPSNAGPPPPPPMAPMYYEERKAVVEERGSPSSHYHQPSHNSHSGALIIQERDTRSDRDIQSEIARLEAERRALRLERDAEDKRNMALRIRENRTEEDYQLVEYREPRQTREVVDVYERDKSPPRNVLRVEKDRKEKARKKKVALAVATLS